MMIGTNKGRGRFIVVLVRQLGHAAAASLMVAGATGCISPASERADEVFGGDAGRRPDAVATADSGASPGAAFPAPPPQDAAVVEDSSLASNPDAAPPAACPPSWTVTAACGGPTGAPAPNFGPNVLIFDPSMSMSSIQSQLDGIYALQDGAQFGTGRYAYFFKPGQYALDVQVGFYTQVVGLGQSPDDVTITGAVRAKADWLGDNNATCNFWRGVENLAVVPTPSIDGDVNVWATSQGTHLRRMHVQGDLVLDDLGGWASGGFIADSLVDGNINSGTQQQYLTRNDDGAWMGSSWNMVFVGDGQPPEGSWPSPPTRSSRARPSCASGRFSTSTARATTS